MKEAGTNYEAARVYVVFDTEAAQRACLAAMSLGRLPAALDWTSSVPTKYQWPADGNVLDVAEAPEPAEVRWDMLGTTFRERLAWQCGADAICLGLVAAGFALLWSFKGKPAVTALIVVGMNAAFPTLFKEVARIELHLSTVSQQRSLLLKLLVARMFTTGFAIFALAGPDAVLTPAFLNQVRSRTTACYGRNLLCLFCVLTH